MLEDLVNRLTVTELINGRATAHYQDETGNEIPGFPPIEKTGNELESFTFDQIEIDNYEFVKREGPLTGFFTKEPIETKFIYKEKKLDLIQSAYHLQEKNYYLNVKGGNLSVEDFRGIGGEMVDNSQNDSAIDS